MRGSEGQALRPVCVLVLVNYKCVLVSEFGKHEESIKTRPLLEKAMRKSKRSISFLLGTNLYAH